MAISKQIAPQPSQFRAYINKTIANVDYIIAFDKETREIRFGEWLPARRPPGLIDLKDSEPNVQDRTTKILQWLEVCVRSINFPIICSPLKGRMVIAINS